MNYVKNSASFRKRSRRSRGLRRRFFALALLLVCATAAALAIARHSASKPPRARVEPAVPRAIAAPGWSPLARRRLRAALDAAFAPALDGADRWSLAVVGGGELIYDNHAYDAVTPASVQKLIVAATALHDLGPRYRYHTIFAAVRSIGSDGVLPGNLWLVGSGDPSLQTGDLRNGVAALAGLGLRRIAGSVAVDAGAMDGPAVNPHWSAEDDSQAYGAPISAVSLDDDARRVRQSVDGDPQTFWEPVGNVPRYVDGVLRHLLAEHGIHADDPPAVDPAPLDSIVLWDHRSAPLRDLEATMLFVSDNHYAEQLLRTIGGEESGRADDAGGLAAERRFMSEWGVPQPGARLLDGSGLARGNRVAAVTLATLLSDEQLHNGNLLYLLLPLGGRQGTLDDYDFTSALGRVRAKTGHITGVSSLAGYVNTRHHGRVAFAFLINGSPGDPDAAIIRAVDRLARF
jgi:D-alanyl-D-alanine carboxypeptidase/D-alanyl-D-alanine-endopeptidase (penicillin-binding protein 4)